jgi:hypothetical protein
MSIDALIVNHANVIPPSAAVPFRTAGGCGQIVGDAIHSAVVQPPAAAVGFTAAFRLDVHVLIPIVSVRVAIGVGDVDLKLR